MPFEPVGGRGSGGGGGILLRVPNDVFNGATKAAAETARDAAITDTTPFDENPALAIIITWPVAVTDTVYQARRGSAWADVTGVVRGPIGPSAIDGAPGGGAIEQVGDILDGTASRPANEFIGTGIMLGERGDTPYLAYSLVPSTLALLWFSTDGLYDIAEAAAGDTSTDGTGTIERNRLRMPESAGSSVSGSVDAGRTAANELLLSTTSANVDITVEFFRYIPSVAQGGLTDAERAELNRLSGVETDAKDDQTGAEIKAAYEGESDTNAYTDTEKSKLGAVEAAATADQTGAEIKAEYEGEADTNALTDARVTKLAGIAPAANQLTPYKLGNVYRAFAAGANVVKPGNTEGTATISGITVAPVGWQLSRPEATAALPHVYDCHVYGYVTNGVFGVQYGTPNRTDRYIAPGGTGIDAVTANGLIQAALADAVTGNTETGITVTHNTDGTFDFVVSGGGTPMSMPTDDIYFGISADDTPDPGELILAAVNGVVTINAYVGSQHVLVARLATEADITNIQRGDDVSNTNQIGAFTKFGMSVIPMNETLSFSAWVSNQALDQAADVEWSVS